MAYDPSSRRERFVAGAVIVVLALGIVVDSRFASTPLARVESFPPTVDAVAFCAYALSSWMLVAQYRVRGYGPLAILGAAFAFAAAMQGSHLVFYEGMLGKDGSGIDAAQAAPWSRIVGHVVSVALILAYAVADRSDRRTPHASRRFVGPVWAFTIATIVATIVLGGIAARELPHVFDPRLGILPLYAKVLFPIMLAWTCFAAFVVLVLGRRGSRLRVWLCVVLAANCGYLVAVILGEKLFTSGFYVSRVYDLVGAFTFVVVVQTQIVSILHRSQRTAQRAHALSQIIAVGDTQSYAGLNSMLTRVAREFEFDYVALCRKTGGEFVVEFAYGSPGFPIGFRTPVAESISQRAIELRSLYVVDDLAESEWAVHPARTRLAWASCCILPVFFEDGLYGSVVFGNAIERPQSLTSLERDFLQLTGVLVGNGMDRIRQKKRLDELAYYDALTGLPNRVMLVDRITTAVVAAERYGGRVAVHFMDLDSFKPINDRYGHAVGDEVLREVGRRLERTVRASDTVARYGGDEFVILQPVAANTSDADDLAARIAQAFRAPVVVAAGAFEMSFSIGVSAFPDDGTDAHTLLIRADEAQYRVKDARKGGRSNPIRDTGRT